MFKRIIPLILVVVILFSLSAPAFAADVSGSYVQLSYWDQFLYNITDWLQSGGLVGDWLSRAIRFGSDSLCVVSEDGYHHSSYTWVARGGGRDGSASYSFRCDYCDQLFSVTPDQMEDAYNDYVAGLDDPNASYGEGYVDFSTSQTVNERADGEDHYGLSSYVYSWGSLAFDPFFRVDFAKPSSDASYYFSESLIPFILNLGIKDRVVIVAIKAQGSYDLVGYYWDEYGRFCRGIFENPDGYPYASLFGVYSLSGLNLLSVSSTALYRSRNLAYNAPYFLSSNAYLLDSSHVARSSSSYVDLESFPVFSKSSSQSEFVTSYSFSDVDNLLGDVYEYSYTSSSGSTSTSDSFYFPSSVVYSSEYLVHGPAGTDSSSRPGSITGDYGVIGDNNTITNIGSQVIINEADLTYTNPATGETQTIESWQYAYGGRKYTIVTGDGNTVTVTYGDENITINEGDTVYNIYYMVDIPEETPPCSHSYSHTVLASPTCKVTGLDQYTCELCGHSYQAATPATGHTWKIIKDVNTSYDENGALIQEGYTIYECEICGEQYKSTDGSAPPTVNNGGSSGSGGSSGDSSGGILGGIFDKIGELLGTLGGGIITAIGSFFSFILDSLISLAQMLVDKGVKVIDLVLSFFERIPGLFGAFPAFLAAVFPFIPEDMLLIIEFGLAAVVFIGILRWLRK